MSQTRKGSPLIKPTFNKNPKDKLQRGVGKETQEVTAMEENIKKAFRIIALFPPFLHSNYKIITPAVSLYL